MDIFCQSFLSNYYSSCYVRVMSSCYVRVMSSCYVRMLSSCYVRVSSCYVRVMSSCYVRVSSCYVRVSSCYVRVMSLVRHKAGQEERGEILLENSFMRWRCYQGKIMHTTSKNFSVLYVLRKHQQHINIQWHHLRCYFWLIDHPILEQVATPRSFQLESILECPALDVRQLVRNKRRKEYD